MDCAGTRKQKLLTVIVLSLTLPVGAVQEQHSTPSKPAASLPPVLVPKNPTEILRLASSMNGVEIPSAKPWHVKLSYDEFDGDGDNVRSGTIEEFHVCPTKYKRIYNTDDFKQTEVANASGLYRSGDLRWPPSLQIQVREEAVRPLYRVNRETRHVRLDKIDWQVGSTKLPCVILRHTDMIISDNGLHKFCFDTGTIMLRYTRGQGWDETTFNNLILFEGHYVARDVTVTHGGEAFLKIHVEELDEITALNDSFFDPPAGSSGPISGRISVPADQLIDEYLLTQGQFHPGTASGKANVKFVVGKDGNVIQAEALDGSKELQKASLAAIRSYKFRPFLILDRPVEVESSMSFESH